MTSEYVPHQIEWTSERVARLWRYYGTNPAYAGAYFSMHSGASIFEFLRQHIPFPGRHVLDFGCGRGHMLQHLVAAGVSCRGVEFSTESAEEAERTVGLHPCFGGVVISDGLPTPVEGACSDVVLLVEVIEHFFEDALVPTLEEVHRLLRPHGYVAVTTPHAENLEASMLHCPECGCTFHHWQHLRSFTVASLADLMRSVGFEQQLCRATHFRPTADQPGAVGRFLRSATQRLRGVRSQTPHLVYIGRKPRES